MRDSIQAQLRELKGDILQGKKNTLPEGKKIEMKGALTDPKIQGLISDMASNLGFSVEQIEALILRESGGDPRAKSSSGSHGLMQLTGGVFEDMYRIPRKQENGKVAYIGRGIGEYLDDFQAIPETVLTKIEGSHPELVKILRDIQKLTPKDQSKFSAYTKRLQTLTRSASNNGDAVPNLIMGSLYLASISDRIEKNTVPPSRLKGIISAMRKIRLDGVNQMLTSKGFSAVSSQSELNAYIENIIGSKEKFNVFFANYSYNGDAKRDADGIEHRLKYGIVLCISEDELKAQTRANPTV